MTPVLTRRAINRATLQRQLLLERSNVGSLSTLEHLVGLQAQTPQTWYVGLWTRLVDFRAEELSRLLEQHKVVRMALMRATIHLVTADDALLLRPLFGAVLERNMSGNFGKHLVGLDREELSAAGREVLESQPLIFSQLGRELAKQWPDRDPASLAQGVRASEALVQVTPRGLWGRSGPAAHTTVQAWLGQSLRRGASVDDLVLRYLGAFGPAAVKDVQTWSGLTRLREVVERLRPRLVVLQDDEGSELYDIPDAPRPDPDTPAPARFLYDYDNLLLSHADRSRFITEDYFAQNFRMDGPMPRIVLVDGFTNGRWTLEQSRASAILTVQPFRRLTSAQRAELTDEAAGLVRFTAPYAASHDVHLLPAGS